MRLPLHRVILAVALALVCGMAGQVVADEPESEPAAGADDSPASVPTERGVPRFDGYAERALGADRHAGFEFFWRGLARDYHAWPAYLFCKYTDWWQTGERRDLPHLDFPMFVLGLRF